MKTHYRISYETQEELKTKIVHFTRDCRPDMHEPDEQGLSARCFGTILDNAHRALTLEAIVNNFQDIHIILERDDEREPLVINLCDLLSLARL